MIQKKSHAEKRVGIMAAANAVFVSIYTQGCADQGLQSLLQLRASKDRRHQAVAACM
jgi:hypothetical protein